MKIKTRQYLTDLHNAEMRGYDRGQRDAYKDQNVREDHHNIFDRLCKLEDEIREMKRPKETGEVKQENVGDKIADKCF